MQVLRETDCPNLTMVGRGKVRDLFDLGEYQLQVATDRLSALDKVSGQPVPEKGRVLTKMSAYYFKWFKARFPWLETHFVTTDLAEIIALYPVVGEYRDQLDGRSTLVRKANSVFKVEVVPRGFMYGTAWENYRDNGGVVCGIQLPPGLVEAQRLPWIIVTPSTKAPQGQHDENISFDEAMARGLLNGIEVAASGATSTLLYGAAAADAEKKGILLCDTKFEFGIQDGKLMLIDEVITPDSSRFWPADQYQPGRTQPSFDKQPVRDYLHAEQAASRWDGKSTMPPLPDRVIEQTTELYLKALEMLTA